jgi:hypothetical protein
MFRFCHHLLDTDGDTGGVGSQQVPDLSSLTGSSVPLRPRILDGGEACRDWRLQLGGHRGGPPA